MRSRIAIPAMLATALLVLLGAAASAPAEQSAAGADEHGLRDVVLAEPAPAAARKMAKMSSRRYPVGDAADRTVQISVTTLCEVACDAGDPQALARFLGELPHGSEIERLSVIVADKDSDEVGTICGTSQVLACYFSARNLMVVPGDDFVSPVDGAHRRFVVAHEYGHHLANYRRNPPFTPAIRFGTKRWATHEGICPGLASGRYTLSTAGDNYYDNPGEAFAEAYAFRRFPTGVVWLWDESLYPDARAHAAIRADAVRPWLRRQRLLRTGRLGMRRRAVTRRVGTPLDGDVSLRLRGEPDGQLNLAVRNARGQLLARAAHFGAGEQLRVEVCGQRALRVTISRPPGRLGGDYRLAIRRP